MRRLPAIAVVAVMLSFIASACVSTAVSECPDGMDSFTEINVYFGQEKGDLTTVSDEEWQAFLADAITPRFPDGLTVYDGKGQWFDEQEGRVYRESTKVLNVLIPVDTTGSGVDAVREIADAYKGRFDQRAVFYTSLPACAAVY